MNDMKQDWTEKLKYKMDSYEEQPSGDVWKNICEKTGAHSSRHFPAWTWFMLSSAAALAAGVFLLHRNHDGSRAMMAEVPDTEESVFRSAEEETAVPQNVEAPHHFQPAPAAFTSASYQKILIGCPLIIAGIVVIYLLRWRLNILSLSDDEARASGINIKQTRHRITPRLRRTRIKPPEATRLVAAQKNRRRLSGGVFYPKSKAR